MNDADQVGRAQAMRQYELRMGTLFSGIYFGPEQGEVFDIAETDVFRHVGSLFASNDTRRCGFFVLAGTHTGYVDVMVKAYDTTPQVFEDASLWEDMTITSFVTTHDDLTAQPSPETCGDGSPNLIHGAGTYAVRILARGLDGIYPDDLTETGPDSYHIEIWPAQPGDVVDQWIATSEAGKVWYDVYHGASPN